MQGAWEQVEVQCFAEGHAGKTETGIEPWMTHNKRVQKLLIPSDVMQLTDPSIQFRDLLGGFQTIQAF